MKLTLAQKETLQALVQLGRRKFFALETIVWCRAQVRLGEHQPHFEKHWGLMVNRTLSKLNELKEKDLVTNGKGKNSEQWAVTAQGAKLAKELG